MRFLCQFIPDIFYLILLKLNKDDVKNLYLAFQCYCRKHNCQQPIHKMVIDRFDVLMDLEKGYVVFSRMIANFEKSKIRLLFCLSHFYFEMKCPVACKTCQLVQSIISKNVYLEFINNIKFGDKSCAIIRGTCRYALEILKVTKLRSQFVNLLLFKHGSPDMFIVFMMDQPKEIFDILFSKLSFSFIEEFLNMTTSTVSGTISFQIRIFQDKYRDRIKQRIARAEKMFTIETHVGDATYYRDKLREIYDREKEIVDEFRNQLTETFAQKRKLVDYLNHKNEQIKKMRLREADPEILKQLTDLINYSSAIIREADTKQIGTIQVILPK